MTYHTSEAAFPCNGTSALAPVPTLVLIEGGRCAHAESPRSRREPLSSQGALSLRQTAAALFVALLVVGSVVVASVVSDSLRHGAVSEALEGAPTQTVVVREGDTLWGIASEHARNVVPTSQVVSWIEEANGLEGGALAVGQSLVVPAPQAS